MFLCHRTNEASGNVQRDTYVVGVPSSSEACFRVIDAATTMANGT